ncbi:MAG: hypothetical protein F6K55_01260 [Moorea sp. SIO4A3]|nr:hypothetical protein [Moorena sp. SIO4A3]
MINSSLLPIAYCLLPIAYCLLPIAYCLLPIAYCLLPIAYCLLPIAYCLLPMEQVMDTVSHGLVELGSSEELLRSMTYFPDLRISSLNAT